MQELFTGKYTIKQIFSDHWDSYLAKHRRELSDHVVKTVNKMLACRDPKKLGFAKYACPHHPGEVTVIPHSCKSKFCNVCGSWQTDKWMKKAIGFFPNTTYYHITFTIPDYLWYILRDNPYLSHYLFKASAEVVLGWFKERGIIPAICSGMHTFGKKINANFHIHMIVSIGGLHYKKGVASWKSINFFPFKKMVKARWRAILLKYLKPYLDPDLKEHLYSLNWYVYVNMQILDLFGTCKYIGRYSKKPPLAETRITDYDGEFVTFFYKERGKAAPSFDKLHWEEFISRLIQHILPAQFRVIRYYGLLANRTKGMYEGIVSTLLGKVKKASATLKWRWRQLKYRGFDPLICKICGEQMVLEEIAFPSIYGGLFHRIFY